MARLVFTFLAFYYLNMSIFTFQAFSIFESTFLSLLAYFQISLRYLLASGFPQPQPPIFQ